jgi:hypothetical protein
MQRVTALMENNSTTVSLRLPSSNTAGERGEGGGGALDDRDMCGAHCLIVREEPGGGKLTASTGCSKLRHLRNSDMR